MYSTAVHGLHPRFCGPKRGLSSSASSLSGGAATWQSRLTRAELETGGRRMQCMVASAVEHAEGLVLPRGGPGSWDEGGLGSPVVRCFINGGDQRWCMWYSGRDSAEHPCDGLDAVTPGSGSLGVAISLDGIHWVRGADTIEGSRGAAAGADVGKIMEPNPDWWTFDTAHLSVSDVQILSSGGTANTGAGVFWMFYCGGDFNAVDPPAGLPGLSGSSMDSADEAASGPKEGLRIRPGLAMSQDGRNWARIEGDHHTGALLDVGEAGEWDELMVCGPQVLNAAPKDMRLFYHSWDASKGRYMVGLAKSPDGFRWQKQGVAFDPASLSNDPDAFDALGATARHVVKDVDNRQYVMFYEAVARDNTRSIGMAVSKDGLKNWKRCPTPVLKLGEAGAWDSGSVGAPCAVSMSAGKWRVYYSGRKEEGPWDGIGLALSVDDAPLFEGVPQQFKRRSPTA